MDAEVLVVGAGPVGVATALGLASRGRDVLVLHNDAGDKVCGEGLMPHGVDALRKLGVEGVLSEIGSAPFAGICWQRGDLRAVGHFPGRRDGHGVRRDRFDAALRGRLVGRATVRLGRLRSYAVERGGVTAQTDGGELRAQFLVGADGLHSTVRRAMGAWTRSRGAVRVGVRERWEGLAAIPTHVEVHVAGDAEFYVTPVGEGAVNVALLGSQNAAKRWGGDVSGGFLTSLATVPALLALRGAGRVTTTAAAVGPLRQRASTVVGARVLLAGDAGGFIDGITGEGMSLGLLGAELGAQALDDALRSGSSGATALATYARRRRRLERDAEWLTELVLWWVRHPGLGDVVLRRLRRRPELFDAFLAVQVGSAPFRSLLGWVPRLLC